MTKKFGNLPVQAKLATIMMVACSSLVLVMAVLFVCDKIYSFRQSMQETHEMLAVTIAKNSSAALIFDDAMTAYEILSALKAVPDVVTATLFNNQGNVFAVYTKEGIDQQKRSGFDTESLNVLREKTDKMLAHSFHAGFLDTTAVVMLDGTRLGYIVIHADLKRLYSRLIGSMSLVILFLIILGLIAQFFSVRIHRTFAKPLFDLLDTMELVGRENCYSHRVPKLNNDEFGVLTDRFNNMLVEIEKRDEELARHRNTLESLVKQRTKELLNTNKKLQKEIEERKQIQDQLTRAQRMEAIGTLAGGVAHDLNNILSGVVSYPELLLMRLSKDDEMYKPLTTIKVSGQKAADIVQDLLTLARRGALVAEVLDFRTIVQEYIVSAEYVKLLSEHPGVRIEKNIGNETYMVKGSPVHLSKTIMNLVTNSAEAIINEGVVTIELSNCYLTEPVHGYEKIVEGRYVKLCIRDTGHGIKEEDLQYIFEPFYTRKKMGMSGTGLGMAVVWGTVEDHQGYIDVESVPGKGTCFSLYFPSTDEEIDQVGMQDLHAFAGKGESILVVDDVKEQRLIAADILRELGYGVDVVASGEEAVLTIKTKPYDLIILDMIMEPGIDGIETFKQILKIRPEQRAIIASGFSEVGRVELARELGVAVYLRKPYTIPDIAMGVREELDRNMVG